MISRYDVWSYVCKWNSRVICLFFDGWEVGLVFVSVGNFDIYVVAGFPLEFCQWHVLLFCCSITVYRYSRILAPLVSFFVTINEVHDVRKDPIKQYLLKFADGYFVENLLGCVMTLICFFCQDGILMFEWQLLHVCCWGSRCIAHGTQCSKLLCFVTWVKWKFEPLSIPISRKAGWGTHAFSIFIRKWPCPLFLSLQFIRTAQAGTLACGCIRDGVELKSG